jgi:hypothetical protein
LLTFETGYGFWNPLIWLVVFLVIALIVIVIRALGEKSYKPQTDQTKPFLAGNPEVSKEGVVVRGGNVYWGFFEALRKYYEPVVNAHSGVLNDYIAWFVIVLALIFILLTVVV